MTEQDREPEGRHVTCALCGWQGLAADGIDHECTDEAKAERQAADEHWQARRDETREP